MQANKRFKGLAVVMAGALSASVFAQDNAMRQQAAQAAKQMQAQMGQK